MVEKKMYSFEEIGLVPKALSSVQHRADVNPFTEEGKLPIFVSPMTCILDSENIHRFSESKVIPILPVTPDLKARKEYSGWVAISILELETLHEQNMLMPSDKLLIDCANGHMAKLYSLVRTIKRAYPGITIMVGNIANPKTYLSCVGAGVDYVRVGIGGGSGCTTSVLTGFHTSLPWILQGIQQIREQYSIPVTGTKVIADGGVNTISKAIKSLALGADYVMMGRCFAECEEACGEQIGMTRHYYGQASEQGQLDRFGEVRSEPEGCGYFIDIKHSLDEFTGKFEACLRSAMSYAGAHNLSEFIGKVDYEIMSASEFNSFNK